MNNFSERLEGILRAGGLRPKSVSAYGRQVVVVCWSEETARRVADLLGRSSFRVRGVLKSREYDKTNRNTVMNPSTHVVYKVFATA